MTALAIGDEVRSALAAGRGVVALETSVVGQGLPHPRNLECVERMDRAIRSAGCVPAWTGVDAGRLVVGMDGAALGRMAIPGRARKVARRDVAPAIVAGILGATTVSATLQAAAAAGIAVSATGGIGGVHRGSERDVSADLLELARTPGLLVCAGAKSIVDPVATADLLEELGVPVVGYGVDRLPFFLAREAQVPLAHRVDDARAAADVLAASYATGAPSTVLLCNPVPAASAMADRKSTRLNSSHVSESRMPSSA